MQNKNIIIIYGPPWDQPAQLSKHQFAKLWSKNNRVLYVESPINSASFFTRYRESLKLWKRYKKGPIKVKENLWISTFFYFIPFRGSKYLFGAEWVNKVNQYFLRKKFKKQVKDLKFNNPILIVGSAHILPIIDIFKAEKVIYHCSDDYTLVPSFPRSFENIEKKLLTKCDQVVTTADKLKQAKEKFNSNIISIPNGVDIDHFKSTQSTAIKIHENLSSFSKPIIGYVGTIFRWINQDWIKYAAINNKNFNFIFIGPITTNISKLEGISNIYFLGPKPYSELPSYLKAFSIATIPFVIDGVTLKASPIKFYEYLSAGIPIVSTDLPDLKDFDKIVTLVKNKEKFSDSLVQVIKKENSERKEIRMKIAKKYSWKQRLKQFNDFINYD
ncbi:MAG: hypothetical protein CMG55_03470 [Candidatus Marinimicrobia bacterium]|nr:hypothetical protein [Candidatus Neomarinimicrobiota bacterium]|tara:strand:- start:2523 stop:3680 length:1158 start_codon:yes stop_codon:yes gene_type:complete